MSWRDCLTPWPGQPGRCTCTAGAVATFEETLACPLPWGPVPGGWAHAPAQAAA
ncbi:MAG TPA: hypothetical protein VFY14_08920 [Streptomyces sp.]|nr:hypothetical protein [Streptomyces sp.]